MSSLGPKCDFIKNICYCRQNKNDVTCQKVNTDTIEIWLDRICDDHKFIHWCPPMYISVEYNKTEPTTNFRCNEKLCPTPDSARYVIFAENLRCHSGASGIFASLVLLVASILMSLRLFS